LKPRQLGHVLIDALVFELPQRADHVFEFLRIDVLTAQHAPEIACVVRELTLFTAQLALILWSQAHRPAVPPSAPRALAVPRTATINATVGEAAVRRAVSRAAATTVATGLLTLPALPALTLALALPLLALAVLSALTLTALALLTLLALSLPAALALLPIATLLALTLTLLIARLLLTAATSLLATSLLPVLTLPVLVLSVLALTVLALLAALLRAFAGALAERLSGTRQPTRTLECLLTPIAGRGALTERRGGFVKPLPHVLDAPGDLVLGRLNRSLRR
jgi:hypothetical protein